MKLPKIPKRLNSVGGTISVKMVDDLKDEKGVELLGYWNPTLRVISLRTGLLPHVLYQTYRHELTHAVFWDFGVKLQSKVEEQICDVLASFEMFQLQYQKTKTTGNARR